MSVRSESRCKINVSHLFFVDLQFINSHCSGIETRRFYRLPARNLFSEGHRSRRNPRFLKMIFPICDPLCIPRGLHAPCLKYCFGLRLLPLIIYCPDHYTVLWKWLQSCSCIWYKDRRIRLDVPVSYLYFSFFKHDILFVAFQLKGNTRLWIVCHTASSEVFYC